MNDYFFHILKYYFYSLKYNYLLKIDNFFYKLFYKIIYLCPSFFFIY